MTLERPFLKTTPCEACNAEVGDGRCWCDPYDLACRLAEYARESASAIRRFPHMTDESRAELAASTADAIANAMDDVGAELDDRAFTMACGAHGAKVTS